MKCHLLIAVLQAMELPNAEVVVVYDSGCAVCGIDDVRLPIEGEDYQHKFDNKEIVVIRTDQ